MNIVENAAYLKGLYDGYGIDKDSKEGKLMGEMLDLISMMANEIAELKADNKDLREYVEELDEDLADVEDYLDAVDANEEYDDEYDEDYECEEDSYYELVCPSCGETVCFDDSLEPDEISCPACGEKITDVQLCDGDCDACDSKDCE